MKEILIEGKYATAKVFSVDSDAHAIDQYAMAQIKMICDDEVSKDAKIRVMPDVHAGKVGPIGLTMKLAHDRIIPNLIGPDIGCGISVIKLDVKKKKLTNSDFEKLDKVIRENIPSGSKRHGDDRHFNLEVFSILNGLFIKIDTEKVKRSLCTLGGGNHFIEIDQDEEGNYYLVIHTGSRSLGPMINTYYNNEGQKALKEKGIEVPYEMTYVEDVLYGKYINDVRMASMFAAQNRLSIAIEIASKMKWRLSSMRDHPHNYFDDREKILHKGSTTNFGSMVYIPINMKDGIIYGKPMNNEDWNNSLPHGAGRLLKRSEVANSVSLSMFKKEMDGIYSTSVTRETLDESPFAYRRIDEIKEAVSDVIDVKGILKPVYNFKAGGNE